MAAHSATGRFSAYENHDMLKPEKEGIDNEEDEYKLYQDLKLSKAIVKITFISLSLSFDNILAIAGAADGNIRIISLGLLLSLPILLLSCRLFMNLMKRHVIILYLCGAVLIHTSLEMIFSYPGIGLTIMNAILSHDYPLIQGCFAIIAVSVVTMNFIADLIYPLIDPRVSLS